MRCRGRHTGRIVLPLAVALTLGCGLPDPGDKEPTRKIRKALRTGMTLPEVCAASASASPETGTCLVGRRCKGAFPFIAVDVANIGHEVSRLRLGADEESAVVDGAALEQVFRELARDCLILKVGDGYYEVHLLLDDAGRVRDISPTLIEGNRETPTQ